MADIKDVFVIETKDGKWLFKKGKITNGLVNVEGFNYNPNPTRSRLRRFRSWLPLWRMQTRRVFLFREGDPESIPLLKELKGPHGETLGYDITSGDVVTQAMISKNITDILKPAELNWWVIFAVLLVFVIFILGGALYASRVR